jgi:putative SOS response-associated peptidase YedK
VRKVVDGEATYDLVAFLTCDPNAEVGAVHPKAMPVILTQPTEIEARLTALRPDARTIQGPSPDGALRIVAQREKQEPPAVSDARHTVLRLF